MTKISRRLEKKQAESLVRSNRLPEARELYLKICRKQPRDYESLVALSVICRKLDRLQEAEQAGRQAHEIQPEHPDALHALGAALHRQNKLEEAVIFYRKSIHLNPDSVETNYFLANALREKGAAIDAESQYQKTLSLQPDHVEALNNLAALLTNRGKIQRSAELLHRALQVSPDNPHMLINLGRASLHAGDADAAEKAFRRAIDLQPDLAEAHSNLLACLNYLPGREPRLVYEDHCRWSSVHAGRIQPNTSWPNSPDTQRKIRIGYVSPDFRGHSVARFLSSVLVQHDQEQFEIICYSDVAHPDGVTAHLRKHASGWCDAHGLSQDQLAARIQEDRIDILVDLAGHTANNRQLVFARKPAPVQVTWLGYPNTTGQSTMDYRLTDDRADPPGESDDLHTETLVRLPNSFLCFSKPVDAPATGTPPSLSGGHITFGSFNNLAKVTPEVVRVWSRILSAVPDARMLFKSRATGDPEAQQRFLVMFAESGVSANRIIFQGPVESANGHLAVYNKVDIALDTFPYHGTTTTCEALWMGVPVIALAGQVHAARVGVSLLSQVGLDEVIAFDENSYIAAAVELAGDPGRLVGLRDSLRNTLSASSLCDASGFTRELEKAFRTMWADWCSLQR